MKKIFFCVYCNEELKLKDERRVGYHSYCLDNEFNKEWAEVGIF